MNEGKDKLQLYGVRIVALLKLSPEFLEEFGELNTDNFTFQTLHSFFKDMIRCVARVAVLEELLTSFPADWWQAFKARWFPIWLRGRFPVRVTEIRVRHKFPEYHQLLGREYVEIFKKGGE